MAVFKALSMGGDFRWGWGRMKAAGGVVIVEPEREPNKILWGKEGETLISKSTWL